MSEISDKMNSLSSAIRDMMGLELESERATADGTGRCCIFERGAVYWHPHTGAHEIHGAIYAKWNALGRDHCHFLRYPHTDELTCADDEGRFNHFYNPGDWPGSIYWHPLTGAFEVHGLIRHRWSELGWENHPVITYPITDETSCIDGTGRFNHFRNPRTGENGSIYWHPVTGPHEVSLAIWQLWSSLGFEGSVLGYPRTGEQDSIEPGGRFNDFQHGSIYWHPNSGAYEVFEPETPITLPSDQGGQWTKIAPPEHIVGMHAAVLPKENGSILLWSYDHHEEPAFGTDTQAFGESCVWTPGAPTLARTTYTGREGESRMINIFCGGQAFMADGRLLAVGGDRERATNMRSTHIYDPSTNHWTFIRDAAFGRWYCTVVCLNDGRMLAIGGQKREVVGTTAEKVNDTYEIFHPATNTFAAPQPAPIIHAGDSYPFVFVLPNRRLFVHAGDRTQLLNLETHTWEPAVFPSSMFRTYGLTGTAVLLPLIPNADGSYRSRILMIGGSGSRGTKIRTPATDTCEIFDADLPSSGWTNAASMHRPRVMPDSVLLPNATVLVLNGSSTGYADAGANPVYLAEIYDPASGAWTSVNSMSVPRLYHASAVLMPDGSVITAGTDADWNPGPFHRHEFSLEVYEPPYLFIPERPVINQAPATVLYASNFTIEASTSRTIVSVCLIRCGSVTHSFNSDQRYVELVIGTIRQVAGESLDITVNAPNNGYVAPPGNYMLFIRDNAGAVSVARFVRLQ